MHKFLRPFFWHRNSFFEHRAKQWEILARIADQCSRAYTETPKFHNPCRKNMVTYPPMTHTFPKRPFLSDFKRYNIPPHDPERWFLE